MKMGVTLFCAAFLIVLVSAVTGEENVMSPCNVEKVTNCTRDLDVLGKEMAPFYDSAELDSLCRRWQQAVPCLDLVAVTCQAEKDNGTEAMKTFERIVARKRAEQAASEWVLGYEFLCQEGRSGYPLIRECLSKDQNITHLAEECYKTYENRTWWLDPDEPLNTHKYCKAAREFFDCLKDIGKKECGKDFAKWVWSFQEELWSPHLHHIECFIGNEFSPGEIFIVTLCGTATVVCIVLSILSFVCKSKEKVASGKKVTPKKRPTITQGHSNLSFLEEIGESSTDPVKSTVIRRAGCAQTNAIEVTEM